MKELKLKHLAAYLPYNLKMIMPDGERILKGIDTATPGNAIGLFYWVGKGEQQDPKLIGGAIDVCVRLTTDGKEYILNVRNELLVKRLKWAHEQLTITYKKLEWTESERRRFKEKSDKLRKELHQLKKTVITDREIQEGD